MSESCTLTLKTKMQNLSIRLLLVRHISSIIQSEGVLLCTDAL
jgi:hypothetical protein